MQRAGASRSWRPALEGGHRGQAPRVPGGQHMGPAQGPHRPARHGACQCCLAGVQHAAAGWAAYGVLDEACEGGAALQMRVAVVGRDVADTGRAMTRAASPR
eukprot:108190-Chlamydomonas_euryale.AAC.2